MRRLVALCTPAHQNSLVATIGSLCERLHAFLEALTCLRLARLLCQLDCRPLRSARSILLLIRNLYTDPVEAGKRLCLHVSQHNGGPVAAVQLLGQMYCEN